MTSRIDRRHNLSDSYKMAALAMGPELRLGGTLSLEIVPAGSQCILEHDQVELKRKYNDQHSKTRGLLPGSQWYEIQAYRALNQALGRCIRHKNDWGALILVDDRFRSNPNKYITGLSKWVRQQVQHHATFSNALVSLVGFAKKHQDAIDSPHHSHSQAPHGQSNVHELTANPSLLDLTVHPPLKDVVETGRGITFHDNYPLCSARVSTVPAPASSHSSQSFIKAKTGDQVLEAESRGCLSVENENFGSVKLRSDIARTEKKKWKSWNTPESMGSFFNCKPITSTPMPGSSKTCTTPVIDLCQENLESESYQPTFSICRRPSQSVYLKPNSSPLSSSRLKTDATIVVEPLDTWDGGNEDLCSDRIPVLDIDLSPVKEEGNVSVLPLPVVDNGDESMYFTPPLYDEGYCVESDYPGDGLLAPSVTTVAEHKTNVNAERFSVSVDKLFEISSPRSDSLGIDVITHTASCTASRDRVTHHQQGLGNAVIATTDVVNVEKLEPTNLEHTPIRKNRLSRSRNRGDQVLEAESRGCLSVENENFGSVKLRSDIARTEKKKWKSWNTPESMGSFFNCKPITSTPMPGSSKTCTTPVIDLCQENLESESYQPTFSICRRPSQSVYLKPNSSPLSSSRLKTDATIVVEPLDTWDGGNEDLCSDRIPVLDIDLSPVKEEGNVSVLPLPVVDNGDESMYFTPPLYDEGYCVESDYPGDGLLAPSVTTVAEHKTNVNAERFSVSVDKLFEISSPRSDSLGIDVITHTASCTASRDRVTHHQQGLGNAVIATTDVVNVEKLEPTNLEHTPIRKNRLSRSRNRGVSSSFNSKSFS